MCVFQETSTGYVFYMFFILFKGQISKLSHSFQVTDTSPCNRLNTLRPRQDGRRFPDDTFKRTFLNEIVIILIKISLKFVPYGPINNIHALVQIMAWRRSGDKPLSEPMMGRLPTHICVTRPQWVKYQSNTNSTVHNYIMKTVAEIIQTIFPIFPNVPRGRQHNLKNRIEIHSTF